jgi:hypothetical protein
VSEQSSATYLRKPSSIHHEATVKKTEEVHFNYLKNLEATVKELKKFISITYKT